MAKGIIFHTKETQLFFILLLQATTSLTDCGCTQLAAIKERDNAREMEPHDNTEEDDPPFLDLERLSGLLKFFF